MRKLKLKEVPMHGYGNYTSYADRVVRHEYAARKHEEYDISRSCTKSKPKEATEQEEIENMFPSLYVGVPRPWASSDKQPHAEYPE
jgi:hypothetical protein